MSIISDALKKVEGNSVTPPASKSMPPTAPASNPPSVAPPAAPLFSVWSVVLSTIMVLVAAVLLFVTWYTNRDRRPAMTTEREVPLVVPVAVESVVDGGAPVLSDASRRVATSSEVNDPNVADSEITAPGDGSVGAETASSTRDAAVAAEEPVASVAAAPASPEAAQVRQRDTLELTGVVYTQNARMAHINGRILREGAKIRGYRIVSISRESVRLSKDNQFYILRLKR